MGRRVVRRNFPSWNFSDGPFLPVLLVVSFAAGAIGGFLLAMLGGESEALAVYLQQYMQAVGGDAQFSVNLWSVVWDMVRWPLLIMLLGMTQFAVIAVPAALFLRAFLLSHAIAVFVGAFGTSGFLAALVIFGVVATLAIPVLFTAAYSSVRFAALRGHGKNSVFSLSREWLFVLLTCVGALLVAAAVQWSLMPPLLSLVCAKLFTL